MGVVERLVAVIDTLSPDGRVAVAIDGPDAAGKTTLARALGEHVDRPVVRASMDGWHNPRETRLRRGNESPVGYYEDSFDHTALMTKLVEPFRTGASTVTTAQFDHAADRRQAVEAPHVPPTAALLLDGVFLLRPELRDIWDLRIYLHVPESVTLARVVERDAHLFGSEEEVRRRYVRRYLPGQALYREEASPLDHADVVIDNSNPLNPLVIRWPGDGSLSG